MVDKKITELPELTTPVSADVLAIVDDTTGTAETKKITYDNFQSNISISGAQVVDFNDLVANNGSVATNTTDINTISGATVTNAGDITNLSGVTVTVSGATVTNANNITNLSGTVVIVSGATVTNAGDITTISGATVTNASDITTISGATVTNAGDITSLSGTVVTISGAVTLNTAKVSNATHTGEVAGSIALVVADNIIDEANLKLDEGATNDYVLTADSTKTGGMKWAASAGGFTDPMTTRGDVIIRDATNTTDRLGIGTNGQVLTSDGSDITWSAVAGTGDVVGPGSAIDENIAVFDSTTGKLIKDGGNTIAETLNRSNHTGSQLASTIYNFDEEVANNGSVATNTSKISYPGSADATELNILDGALTTTTELNYVSGVTSSIQTQINSKASSSDLTTISGATVTNAGDITTISGATVTNTDNITNLSGAVVVISGAVVLNTAKETNVSTNLSLGTISSTTMDVNSSDGTNATLISADTSDAGLLTAAKFDEIAANTLKVTSQWTSFSNNDVDTGTEVVATISIDENASYVWNFTLTNGTHTLTGKIIGSVLKISDGYGGYTYDVGSNMEAHTINDVSSAITLFVYYNTSTNALELKATVDSDNWNCEGKYMRIDA